MPIDTTLTSHEKIPERFLVEVCRSFRTVIEALHYRKEQGNENQPFHACDWGLHG